MAQNVTIAGASYLGVPSIEMPKTGGGTAVFVDTSDANAAAGDITKGKTAYVGGTKITGTLEASSVSVQDTKALTITSNGTVSVTPDAPYDALKKVDVTVNVASGGVNPATLTITSTDYTGNQYGIFIFVNSEGHLDTVQYMGSAFTFPITIETVIGGTVIFHPDGFPGYPVLYDPIGCEMYKYQNTFVTLVTNPQASVGIGNYD